MDNLKQNVYYPLGVFLFFFGVFLYINFQYPYLPGVDSYYHLKHAYLIEKLGVQEAVLNFQWLKWHILDKYKADQWFGFHLFLIPFIKLTEGDLIKAGKIASAFFSSLFLLSFFFVLSKFKVKVPLLWTLVLFFVSPVFGWRLLFVRPFIISMIIYVLLLWAIPNRRYLIVFILLLFYSFSVVESPLGIGMVLSWIAIEYFRERKIDFKLLFYSLIGFLLGFLARPDFPQNIYLIYYGALLPLYLRMIGEPLPFGGEFFYQFYELPFKHIILLFVIVASISFWLLRIMHKGFKDLRSLDLFYIFLFSFFFFLTFVKAQRFIEYFAPLSVLIASLSFSRFVNFDLRGLMSQLNSAVKYSKSSSKIRSLAFLLKNIFELIFLRKKALFEIIFKSFLAIFVFYVFLLIEMLSQKDILAYKLKVVAEWLKENTPPGSLVLNDRFGFFPLLFFYNHQNIYAQAMDPSFFYVLNPQLYWEFRNVLLNLLDCNKALCKSKEKITPQKAYEIFKIKLRGDYLLLSKEFVHPNFDEEITNKHPKIEKVFEFRDINVYKLK